MVQASPLYIQEKAVRPKVLVDDLLKRTEVPAEKFWPLTNEAVANRLFEEIEDLEEALVERCVQLLDQAESTRNLTNYHWWPTAA